MSAAADLPVQPLNDGIGTDVSSVFAGKIAVGQCLLNTVLYFLGSLLQLHRMKFSCHSFGLLAGDFPVLLGVYRLEHLSN